MNKDDKSPDFDWKPLEGEEENRGTMDMAPIQEPSSDKGVAIGPMDDDTALGQPLGTQREGKEPVSLDKAKIDQVLDSFLKEQEIKKEREQQRSAKIAKQKKWKRMTKIGGIAGFALFVLLLIILNPNVQKEFKSYWIQSAPREDYEIGYNYSPGMAIQGIGENIAIYDSSNLRILQKDGTELLDVPLALGNWDMATSNKKIYLLDKIERGLIIIDSQGNFVNEIALNNLPFKLHGGKGGHLVVQYRSEAGVEGIAIFDENGRELEDLTYPKTTLTLIEINDKNQTTVHGMYRMDPALTNVVYRYSERGKQVFSTSFTDNIFVRQYENDNTIAMVDINQIQFYNKTSHETMDKLESVVPLRLVGYDSMNEEIYLMDKRNRLSVVNFQGEVKEEKYFQTKYDRLFIFKGKLLLFGPDFVRMPSGEMKFPKKVEDVFQLGDYLVVVMKGELRLTNKME